MTTQTQTEDCALCQAPGATSSIDGIYYFCEDADLCIARFEVYQATLPKPTYDDASPEMYDEAKAREKQAKRYWEACVIKSRDLKAVLGLDDTTFLTNLKLMAELSAKDEEC